MVRTFQSVLMKNLSTEIKGYFFKRKSYYFDKKQNLLIKSNFLSDILTKFQFNSQKYDKRIFKIDLKKLTLSYAKDEKKLDTNPHYSTGLRNIIGVKRNIVSMPKQDSKTGKITFKEHHINEANFNIDRGPNESCQNVFEI